MFGPKGAEVRGSVGSYFIVLFCWRSEFIRYNGWDICIRYVTKRNSEFW